jgi:hypothetical protein
LQRLNAGDEAVFAGPGGHDRGSPFTRRRNGFRGMVKVPVPRWPQSKILLGAEPDEVAVVAPDPLRNSTWRAMLAPMISKAAPRFTRRR